jgi:predicted regulator of Ras-like GTPase activity (Roadblock/LC7/MglB family)
MTDAESGALPGVLPPHRDPAVIEPGRAALAEMKELCTSLVRVSLLTDDGFEVARMPEQSVDDDRLASMASSIQALSDAVAHELRIGASRSVIIASDHGHVIQRRVDGHELVLAALFDDDQTLGTALSISRLTAERLAAALAEPSDRPAAASDT